MKMFIKALMLGCILSFFHMTSIAADRGTAEEAVAMVKKAKAFMKTHGKEKFLEEINSRKGQFIDRDLYITVYDMNMKNLAHGVNPKMVGKDMIKLQDIDGTFFMKDRLELVKTKGSGWQDFKFVNPVTKTLEPKQMYVEKYEDVIISCGIYKPE